MSRVIYHATSAVCNTILFAVALLSVLIAEPPISLSVAFLMLSAGAACDAFRHLRILDRASK